MATSYDLPGNTLYDQPGSTPYNAPGSTPYDAPGGTPYGPPGVSNIYASSAAVSNGGSTATLTLPNVRGVTGGCFYVHITTYNTASGTAATVSSISDTQGASWSAPIGPRQGPSATMQGVAFIGSVNNAGLTTISIVCSSGTNLLVYATVQPFGSRVSNGGWVTDGAFVSTAGTGTSAAFSATPTPSGPGELCIYGIGIDGGLVAPSGYVRVNPIGAVSLTYNTHVSTAQTETIAVSPNGSFGNDWAAIGTLVRILPNPLGLPDAFAGDGSAPPQVFPGSFWDTPLPTNAPAWWSGGRMIAGNSAKIMSNFVAMYTSQYGAPYVDPRTARYVLNSGIGSDPGQVETWTFNPGGRWDSAPQGTYSVRVPSNTANTPTGFVTGPQTDCETAFWDYNNNVTDSFWVTTTSSGTTPSIPPSANTGQVIAAGTGSNYPGFGPSNVTALSSSTAACGAPYIAYAITMADIMHGAANHMLAIEIGNPTGVPVVPATTSDGVSELYIGQGGIPEGTIVYLPSNLTEPNWSSLGVQAANITMCHVIWVALQTYGGVCIDSTAGGGVGIICESNVPWWHYNPSVYLPNKMYNDATAPYGQVFGTSAASAAVAAIFPSLVVLEPGAFPLPFITDNNGTTTVALESAEAHTLTAGQTTLALNQACNTNDVLIISGTVAAGTTGTTFSAASGTTVAVYDVVQNGTQAPEEFCYLMYGVTSGLSSLTIGTLQAVGDVVITRWSGFPNANPIVTHILNNTGTGAINSLSTGNVAVATLGQIVVGICHSPLGGFYNQFNYAEGSEAAYGASSMTNYNGTVWTGSGTYTNRHILNSNGQMLVYQNWIVPTATGNVSGALKVLGQPQTMAVAALVLNP